MRKFRHWIAAICAVCCFNQISLADHLTPKFLFSARLDGAQEVPAVVTNAVGVGTFFLNHTRDTLCIETTVNGLSGPITGAHIHEGATGVGGPVVLNLNQYISGNLIKATITDTALTTQFIEKLFSGVYYINVHTAANANGEIRGQILPEADMGFMVKMTGAQENPPVTTAATGLGFFMLSHDMKTLSFHTVFDNLSSSFTGTHLHAAPVGVNGPVIENLASSVSGNNIVGSVNPAAYLSTLLADSIYLNVHSSTNGGGEIRGQLTSMPYLFFDAMLNGTQETPSVTTTATGTAVVRLNYTFDTLWYDMQVNGLSGPITAAHFHLGDPGVAGLPVITLSGISGNVISGFETNIADTMLAHLLTGRLYINVHTATNPNGEIRGQVYRTFREGYTYHINGVQETPPVNSGAYGTGLVSINRDQTNVHFMMAVTGIIPNASHFHVNPPGIAGAPVFTLTGLYNNGEVSGYWTDADTTAFTQAFASKFRHDSMYVNFHTPANPLGEIRGDIGRNLCVEIPLSIGGPQSLPADLKLFPNPANSFTRLEIKISEASPAALKLTDVLGKTISVRNISLQRGANSFNIPAADLAPGVYIVQLITDRGTSSVRFMKE